MKSNPEMNFLSTDNSMIFVISAIVCNKKILRNKHVLKQQRAVDKTLTRELLILI